MNHWTRSCNYLTFLVLLTFCLPAAARGKSKLKTRQEGMGIKARMSMRTFSVESEQVNAKIFSYRALFEKDFAFHPQISAHINAGFDLQVGSNTSSILAEYAPERQFLLRDAYAKWQPFSFFELKAGAINQGRGRGLLVSSIPFMGAQQKVTLKLTEQHSFYIQLQQAIPNNYFLAERLGVISDEGTPTFFEEKIGVNLEGDLLSVSGEVSRFTFSDLSTNVAFQSQFIGNTVGGSGGQLNSQFVYAYEGYFTMGRVEMSFSQNFGLDARGQYLFNDGAPDSRNKGHSLTIGARLFNYGLYAGQFRNESDSSPAFYNSSAFAHNNMEGINLSVRTYRGNMAKQQPFEFSLDYSRRSPIEADIYQSDEDRIFLRLTRNFVL